MSDRVDERVTAKRFRRLLRLYPREFREANGSEMERAFLALLRRDGTSGGVRGRLGCWVGATWDVLRTAVPMRIGQMKTGKGGDPMWNAFGSDVRFAIRSWAKRPLFAITAIATLALGIGSTAAIFTLANGLLFTPFPYEEPDELVVITDAHPELGWSDTDISPANAWDWRERSRTLDDLAVFYDDRLNLVGSGPPELVNGVRVTPNILSLLGRSPVLGRDFRQDEIGEGKDRVVILTDGFWARRFARDPQTLGSTLLLDGNAYTVIGVMPEDFVFLDQRPDVLVPLPFLATEADRDGHYASGIARLASGSEPGDADRELTAIAAQLEGEYPDTNAGWTVDVVSAREDLLGTVAERASKILLGAVLFVLLMACVNVANLLLSRTGAREQEMAVRAAMGARRGRVLRQLLTESLTLAICGGALGLVLGAWGAKLIVAALPPELPPVFSFEMEGRVLLFVTAVTALAALLFGLSPALHLVRSSDALRGGSRHGRGKRQGRFGSTLVMVQTTLAMVLLVGGGLLMKSIAGMRNQDFGFDPTGVLTVRVSPPASDYPELEDRLALWNDIETRVQAVAGVTAAGTTQSHPLMGSNWGNTIRVSEDPTREVSVRTTYASPGYFKALGIHATRGRLISGSDGHGAPPVAVVNEAFVDRYLTQGTDPLTTSIFRNPEDEDPVPIVGVIPNMVERGVDDAPEPNWYLHPDQGGISSRSIVARLSGPPEQALPAIQEAVWSVDPKLPLYQSETMEAIVRRRLGGFTLIANLMGAFALLSLVLGAVGIYGVTAFSAGQRGQEIGLRKALGAEEGQVVSMVVRSGAWRAGTGLVLGLVAAAGVARLLEGILVGVDPWDPGVFAIVAATLATISVLGLWIPARRAATVDPVRALSSD